MIGMTLAHYKILEKLGEGGMGQVYVAEDTKLDRRVALKILPPEMASAERRMRFEREAKAVAALNHPNIVTIHSVEEADDVHFITMELVKGKTLTERIPKKGMPLNKFFEVGIPLADAVSAAHEQGIIHRDLKPDNLMVGDDGRLKILDFGLAKLKQELVEAGASELPTQSATGEGRILGTVAYMSPEQAEGKKVDHRSDIFSMGIVFYEMATGERPFKGDSATSVLSSILKDTPQSVTEVNRNVPRDFGKIIKRCLVKDSTRRYQTALDLRNELEELKQEVESGEVVEVVSTAAPRHRWLMPAVALAAALATGTAVHFLRPGEETDVSPIEGTFAQITSQPGLELFPSLSPDGDVLVYASTASGNWDIYRQRAGGETAFNLTEDSVADDTQPAYSPDGEQLAFRSERQGGGIFLMGATGESVRRLTDFGYYPAWSPDGNKMAFQTELSSSLPFNRSSATSQLWTVDIASSEKQLLSEGDALQPSWSPDGKRIAYWGLSGKTGRRDIWTAPVSGGEATRVTDDVNTNWNPVWSPDGKHLYFSSDRGGSMNVWRVLIDRQSGTPDEPQPMITGASASSHITFSKDGRRMAYVEGADSSNIWRVPFDPGSASVRGDPDPITQGSKWLYHPTPSPDGYWVVCWGRAGQQEDIFIFRMDGASSVRLTNDVYRDRVPRWSPDGESISFFSDRSGSYEIWSIRPDGSELHPLTDDPDKMIMIHAWSPDGSKIAYNNGTDRTAHIFDPNKPWEEQTPQVLPSLEEERETFRAWAWSPDGRWLGGRSVNDSGASPGIVVYSMESGKYQRLTDIGGQFAWMHDSRRLLFGHNGAIYKADGESGNVSEVLTLSPDRLLRPSLSSDNRWLYFERNRYEADIWMLTLNEARE